MQTWAKRGLQTALVTGGLLMLGTGIASADEDVNPDRPASPLDGSLTIPVHLDNNQIGTPVGPIDVPAVDKEISVSPSDALGGTGLNAPAAPVMDEAAPVVADAQQAAAPVAAPLQEAAAPLNGAVPGLDDPFLGNRVNGDVVVPVDVSGNAIALLGEASVENDSAQSAGHANDVTTSGSGGFLGGNVVDLDYALPIQITGNSIAGLGTASSTSTATQDASSTGDIETDGSNGALGGNVLAGQAATPLQITGNAIAGGGIAESESQADTTGTSGGTIVSNGSGSAGGGNVGAAPVAVPFELNGNALSGLGAAESESESSADATAGMEQPDLYGVDSYIQTSGGEQGMPNRADGGSGALLGGNVAQAPVSGPALLCGNAGSAAGTSDAECTSDSTTTAGGGNRTTGAGGAGSGSIAQTPVALPVEGFGNAVAGLAESEAEADNTVDSTAGGDAYTRGHDSLASGSTAAPSVSGPVDVFANAVAGAGAADTTASQDATSTSGGNTGTTGDGSLGGGNMVTSPIATPVETFGNVAGGAGTATTAAEETKVSTSGGGSNTDDDNGALASNLVTTPVAGAGQLFGNGGGVAAITDAKAKTQNDVTAGGPAKATGKGGLLSGNIGQAAGALPVQGFGTGATAIGEGDQAAVSDGTYTAGGDATSTGADGLGSGNVVTGPLAGAGQVFGESAASLGANDSLAGSVTDTTAGGDTETDGSGGMAGGNVVAPQALPVVQSFAATAAGVGGGNSSVSTNETDATSGGDIDTNGDNGFLSGNLADVPAAGVVQPFGDAVSAIGSESSATGLSNTDGDVGGVSSTSGEMGSLSGLDATMPIPAEVPIYDVPVEILAEAVTNSANTSDISAGEDASGLALPDLGGLGATELPTMPKTLPALPTDLSVDRTMTAPEPGPAAVTDATSGVLGGVNKGWTGLPGREAVTEVVGIANQATQDGGQYHVLPYPQPRADLPMAGSFGGDLFDVVTENLPQVGTVPAGAEVLRHFTGMLGSVQQPRSDVPGLPEIPAVNGLTALPKVPGLDNLPQVPGVDGVPSLPQVPGVDGVPALPEVPGLDGVPALPGLDNLTQVPGVDTLPEVPAVDGIPAMPQVPGLDSVPAMPAVPGLDNMSDLADLVDVTTVIPTVPGVPAMPQVPGVGDLADAQLGQTPSLDGVSLPTAAVSDVDTAGMVPGTDVLDNASLTDTKAALAKLFAHNPIG
jgi:trimeric autotransporter adhesin